MKSGTIGIPVGEDRPIETTLFTTQKGEVELRRLVKRTRELSLEGGATAIQGRVAVEKEIEDTEEEITENGEVRSRTNRRKVANTAGFIQIPGEFVILESGAPNSAFDVLGRVTDSAFEQANIDIDGFIDDAESETIWMLGFYEHATNAENGTVYGSALEEDPIMDDVFSGSKCNQVGLEHLSGDTPIKARLAESGFVQIYQPTDYEVEEFVQYLLNHVSHHLKRPKI